MMLVYNLYSFIEYIRFVTLKLYFILALSDGGNMGPLQGPMFRIYDREKNFTMSRDILTEKHKKRCYTFSTYQVSDRQMTRRDVVVKVPYL